MGTENRFGNHGGNYYYNGTGTLPAEGVQIPVTGTPGISGETHVLSYDAIGIWVGNLYMRGG